MQETLEAEACLALRDMQRIHICQLTGPKACMPANMLAGSSGVALGQSSQPCCYHLAYALAFDNHDSLAIRLVVALETVFVIRS